ncbi:MAG TPA: FliM/FliN family flagellar motor switch protein [Solirubrobacteraceae bacterium]|nr:FliM/FliN family flagellar motor switch protein [Solirubrobacteraceae bacterium]
MSQDDALIRLGQSTSEAIAGVLEMFAPGKITPGEVSVIPGDKHPMESVPMPAVATSVAYVDGVTGGNVFVMTLDGARNLAAAMMGMEQPEDPAAPELSELELSAVSEAMNQMMASAAIAISSVLGTEVEIGTPEPNFFTEQAAAVDAYAPTPHAVRANFTVCGEPCRLIQLVPNAFVVRMTRALDELGSEMAPPAEAGAQAGPKAGRGGAAGRPSLAGIPVRVWAELGRTRMPSAQVVGMPSGSVVELNQAADEPIDLYVNGTLFATGRLMVVDGTDWAVRIETVLSSSNASTETQMEVASWPESW